MIRSIETERTDIATFLGVLASRLRVQARALQGMAAAEGDATSVESREKSEMAGDLEAVAGRLDLIRQHLCPNCRMMEVVERVSIIGGARQVGRAKRSRASGRRTS